MWKVWLVCSFLIVCAVASTGPTLAVNCTPGLLAKFKDPLPTPEPLPVGNDLYYPLYRLEATEIVQQLHHDLPPTPMWVYGGSFPAPTIEVRKNQKVHLLVINNLPTQPLLPLDNVTMPQDRTVVHLHGGLSKPQYCGHPLDTIRPLPGSNNYTNYYANEQEAALLWYHDHSLQITGANVYAGLVGAYIIRDPVAESGLPSDDYEILLIIADKNLDTTTGKLIYPSNRKFPGGTYNLVNGKVWPYKDVRPGKYRLRILNASNRITFDFYFDNRMLFTQIGSDQGFIQNPVNLTHVVVSPSERIDILVDFSNLKQINITLKNQANVPYPNGAPANDCDTAIIMQFRVNGKVNKQNTKIPKILRKDEFPVDTNQTDKYIILSIDNTGTFLFDNKPFLSRLNPSVPLNTSQIWGFINNMGVSHPVHIHGVTFYVLSRQSFNQTIYQETGELVFTGSKLSTPPNELGPKDTFRLDPFEVGRILIHFGPYPGEYVMHCHILEHEDNDMMQRFAITPVGPDVQCDQFQQDPDCPHPHASLINYAVRIQ